MENMTPSMRLKVKRDTFFLPEPNRGVYFRNNIKFVPYGRQYDCSVD